MKLYLGTTNPGKVREFAGLLAALDVDIEPVSLDVEETEDTFEGNARLKALAYATHTGGVTVAEDSGLAVTALGGLPGPWSARFDDVRFDAEHRVTEVVASGRERDAIDVANNARVLSLLEGVPLERRAAAFVVRLVVARPGEVLYEAGGESHGWISDVARGERGFGYDPIFVGQDTFGKTYAELDPVRKNARSHRRRVLNELKHWLGQQLREGALT